MSKHTWLSDEQVHTLNERHGWFKYGDAQSDVSRAFANDAIEAHERLRSAAPDLLRALQAVVNDCHDLDMVPPNEHGRTITAFELAVSAIAKATGEA